MKKIFYLTVSVISFFNAFSQNNQGTPVTGATPIYREISSNTNTPPPSVPPTTQSTLTAGTPTGGSTEVGITEGQLSVSLSGAANYSIPIAVPPGLNGVVPQISLSYSSQAGNGLAGYGWNITGISSITRIPSTKFHDGTIDGVDFDNLDRFALDGQRLIVKSGTSGVYGADGTVYETENFSNIKVTSIGVHAIVGNGPSTFKVEYPDGSIATYSSFFYSNWTIISWQNPQGVKINYMYSVDQSNNSFVLSKIQYGGLPGSNTQTNEIVFNYVNRQRPEQGYIFGQNFKNTKILNKISVIGNSLNIRNYYLSYNITTLGYQRLESITEKTDNDTKFLNPTVFYYDTTNNNTLFDQYPDVTLPFTGLNNQNTNVVPGDFDADGKTDMIIYFKDNPISYRLITNINSTNSNFGLNVQSGAFKEIFPTSFTNSNNKLMPFQGWCVVKKNVPYSGNYSFMSYNSWFNPDQYTPPLYSNNTKTVNFPSYQIQKSPGTCGCTNDTEYIVPDKKILSGDFNGDGITDVITIDLGYAVTLCIDDTIPGWGGPNCYAHPLTYPFNYVHFIDLKTDITTNFYNLAGNISGSISADSNVQVLDFNGDGKSDFIISESGKVTVYSLNDSNSLVVLCTYLESGIQTNKPFLIGDYNGDGKMDFCIPQQIGQDIWNFYFSNGKDTFIGKQGAIGQNYFEGICNLTFGFMEAYFISSDLNSDGKTDIVGIQHKTTPRYGAGDAFCDPNHNGTEAVSTMLILLENKIANPNQISFVGSTNNYNVNMGLKRYPIIAFLDHNNPRNKAEFSLIQGNKIVTLRQPKDASIDHLLKTITTGNGVVESITYKPLKQEPSATDSPYYGYSPNVFIPEQSFIENYPNQDIVIAPSFKVVAKLEKQSLDVYKKQFYTYYGPVSNVEGIGFLGFRGTMKTNWVNASGTQLISSVSKSNIALRGANSENFTAINYWKANASLPTSGFISKSINTYNIDNTTGAFENPLQTNKVYKLKNTKTESFDGMNGTSAISTINHDIYNNPLVSETVLKNGTTPEQTTTTTIDYEDPTTVGTYVLGRPESKEVKVVLSANADESKSEELYAYTNHLLTTIQKRSTNSGLTTDYLTEVNDYDAYGNITKKTITAVGETPRETNYEYSPSYGYRFLTKSIDIETLATEYTYNSSTGAVLTETLPSNAGFPLKTTYTYDSWGKKTNINDYLNKNAVISYTRQNEKTLVSSISDDGSETIELFDDTGRTKYKASSNLGLGYSYTHYQYDMYDRVIKASDPVDTDSPPSNLWNETKYDGWGRVYQTIDAKGKTTDISFPSNLTTTIYDGTKTKIIIKNAIGNTISMDETTGGTITYDYFANGNLKTTTYEGKLTEITQDGWGRKLSLKDPSAGTYSYQYYGFGEVKKETTPKGFTDYTYTPTGKLLTKWVKVTTAATNTNTDIKSTYEYFDVPTANNFGLLKKITVLNPNDGHSTYTYLYDDWKRLYNTVEEFTGILPRTFTKTLSFDDFGRVLSETNYALAHGKSSTRTHYNQYALGQLFRIKDTPSNVAGNILWELNSQNARGQTTHETFGGYSLYLHASHNYDDYGYPTQTNFYKASGPATYISYGILDYNFDQQRGNLLSRGNSMFAWNESFDYDDLDRLTSFHNAQEQPTTQSYYDNGSIDDNALGEYNYTDPAKPNKNTSIKLTDAGKAYYGSVSNQVISYNAFKSPIQITHSNEKISFAYNVMQDRSIMYYGSTATDKNLRPYRKYYSGDGSIEIKYTKAVAATSTTPAIPEKVEFYTYIGGDAYSAPIVVRKIDTGSYENFCLLRDYQGSILAVVNQAGAVVEKRLYDAWGDILKVQDGAGNTLPKLTFFDRGYTGHEHLQSVGLIHMNGRLYDPKLHRFLQPDNYVQDSSNTQNFNRYGYVLNNPLLLTDQTGEFAWIPVIIGAVIGAYSGGTLANNGELNPTKWQYDMKTLGYMLGGAIVGGLTGYASNSILTSGTAFAGTKAIVVGSVINGMGTHLYTGGKTNISLSIGIASFDFTSGEFGYLFENGNSFVKNLAYGLGAVANFSDFLSGMNPQEVQLNTDSSDLIGHSALTKVGETNELNSLVSVGPDVTGKGIFNPFNLNNKADTQWHNYVTRTGTFKTIVKGINMKSITNYSNDLANGAKYNLYFSSCVNHTARALTLAGAPVFGIHPFILQAQVYLRSIGLRPSILISQYNNF